MDGKLQAQVFIHPSNSSYRTTNYSNDPLLLQLRHHNLVKFVPTLRRLYHGQVPQFPLDTRLHNNPLDLLAPLVMNSLLYRHRYWISKQGSIRKMARYRLFGVD